MPDPSWRYGPLMWGLSTKNGSMTKVKIVGLAGLDAEQADRRDTVLGETPSTGPVLPCHSASQWRACAATCS